MDMVTGYIRHDIDWLTLWYGKSWKSRIRGYGSDCVCLCVSTCLFIIHLKLLVTRTCFTESKKEKQNETLMNKSMLPNKLWIKQRNLQFQSNTWLTCYLWACDAPHVCKVSTLCQNSILLMLKVFFLCMLKQHMVSRAWHTTFRFSFLSGHSYDTMVDKNRLTVDRPTTSEVCVLPGNVTCQSTRKKRRLSS